MESIDKLRDELINEVSKAKMNQPGVAAAVDRYAPQLHRIIQSIDASVSSCCAVHAVVASSDTAWPGPIGVWFRDGCIQRC